jgi:putative DNA methylase
VTSTRKKLIEVSIPLEAINAASAREKAIRHGHPSTLHLWWARRPLAACRAVLFAQLVDDPSSWPDRFTTEAAQDAERKRLHDVIKRMVSWEASNDARILDDARWEIARSVAWDLGQEPPPKSDGKVILEFLQSKGPHVYDPFCGGGSIPLEAQRLGLRASGSDLNPVAVLISKALVEIPPKFTDQPPVNPDAQARLKRGGKWNGKGAQGIAEDLHYYGEWMRTEAEKRIGHLYPKAKLPDGSEATVIAWIWARTVRSPDPSAQGAMVPLVSSFLLSTKEKKKVWIEPVIDELALDGWRFEIRSGNPSKSVIDQLRNGTKSAKAQAFICIRTGSPIERSYIQAEGKAKRLKVRLMAIAAEGARGRIYFEPNAEHEDAIQKVDFNHVQETRERFLDGPTPTRAMITGGVCSAYGLSKWGDLFTDRQIIALSTFSEMLDDVRDQVLFHALSSDMSPDARPLQHAGLGALAYADAIATNLAFVINRSVDRGSTLCSWDSSPKMEALRNTFARQALPMTWDYAEANPFSESSGSFRNNVQWVSEACGAVPGVGFGEIANRNASNNQFPKGGILCYRPTVF